MSTHDDSKIEEGDPLSPPLSPSPSPSPLSREALETLAVETQRKLDEALSQLSFMAEREEKRQRDRRRASMGIVSTPLPTVSHLTDPALRPPQVPTPTRVRFQGAEEMETTRRPPLRSGVIPRAVSDEEKRYQARREKNLSKLPDPGKFSGDKDGDRERVDHWVRVATRYVEGLYFGMVGMEVEKDKMDFILGNLQGTAATWMEQTYQEAEGHTWDQLSEPFVEWVKGGVNLREEWKLQMKKLTFGKGKCTDLIKFDAEFEQLRIRLYPTSSVNIDMNRRSAQDYLDAIERGSRELRGELLNFLDSTSLKGQDPTLSQAREAAQKATMKMRLLSTFNSDRFSQSSGSYSSSSSFRGNRFGVGSGKLNLLQAAAREEPTDADTADREEGEVEQHSLSNVRAQDVPKDTNSSSRRKKALHKERRGVELDAEEKTTSAKQIAAGIVTFPIICGGCADVLQKNFLNASPLRRS